MSHNAEFARRRGVVTTQEWLPAMKQDGMNFIRNSKLPAIDRKMLKQDNTMLEHHGLHGLVEPLQQDPIKNYHAYTAANPQYKNLKGIRKEKAIRDWRNSNDAPSHYKNQLIEETIVGLEGVKPNDTEYRQPESSRAFDVAYWRGRRARNGFSVQQMAAANIARLNDRVPRAFISSADMSILNNAVEGKTTNKQNSQLLKTYGKYLSTNSTPE